MSKRHKARKRLLALVSTSSSISSPALPPPPFSPAPLQSHLTPVATAASATAHGSAPLRSPTPRDVLTGAPLRADVPYFLRVRDYDAARPANDRNTGERAVRAPIPTAIDSSRPYPEGACEAARTAGGRSKAHYAGGLAWTPAFTRYLGPVLPTAVQADRVTARHWWASPYVVARLHAAVGTEAVDAVIAVHRDLREWDDVAAEYEHSVSWLLRQDRRIWRLVTHEYLPPRWAKYTSPSSSSSSTLQRQPQQWTTPSGTLHAGAHAPADAATPQTA